MYQKGQWITGEKGNNVFSYHERARDGEPKVYVPALREGDLSQAQLGAYSVFEEEDAGVLMRCVGLEEFLWMRSPTGAPWYLIDNHNHAFAMWAHGRLVMDCHEPLLLIHVDQHKDMRVPEQDFDGDLRNLEQVERYTCDQLNVGNFIVPAQRAGMVGDVVFWEKQQDFLDPQIPTVPFILDVDLDIFAPELSYLGFDQVIASIGKLLPHATMVTFATSPYFLDGMSALMFLERILATQKKRAEAR